MAWQDAASLVPDSFRKLLTGRPADDQLGQGAVSGDAWLEGLPRLLDQQLERWNLVPDGPARHGECALVLPVRRRGAGAGPSALKLTWPHVEARHEHLALRAWDGQGAVQLLAAAPTDLTLLLERLDADTALMSEDVLTACEVVGGLLAELDRPALPQLDRVADRAGRWRSQLALHTPLVPRRLQEQATSTLDELLADPPEARLVHEDLHDLNVLAPLPDDPDRGTWLAIDPKPVAGEPAYGVAPMVWNRTDAAARAHNLRTHVRLRADIVGDAAGLDPERVRLWTFVRLTLNAVWAADHAPASDEFRSRMIALAKAFAD